LEHGAVGLVELARGGGRGRGEESEDGHEGRLIVPSDVDVGGARGGGYCGLMDIRIGILNAPRELNFESSQTAEEVVGAVTQALESGAAFVRLLDDKGSVFVVPTANLAYVEVGTEESRRVGFVA